MRFRFSLPILTLLLLALPLRAQELRSITAPPQLPHGLTWTMSEREVLAMLKKEGMTLRLEGKGRRFTRTQMKRIRREQGYSESTIRDAATWRKYVCAAVVDDDGYPTTMTIEFLRDRISLLRLNWTIMNEAKRQEFARLLRERSEESFAFRPTESWTETASYPPGEIKLEQEVSIASMTKLTPEEQARTPFHYNWDGLLDGRVYGATIWGGHSEHVMLEQRSGPAPTSKGASR